MRRFRAHPGGFESQHWGNNQMVWCPKPSILRDSKSEELYVCEDRTQPRRGIIIEESLQYTDMKFMWLVTRSTTAAKS